MFVFGGGGSGFSTTPTGALFNPAGPEWTEADCPLTGCAFSTNLALFVDGNFVRVWGGFAYDLTQQTWSPWTLPANTPTSEFAQTYADDGRRIFFLNSTTGSCSQSIEILIYDRNSSSWLATDTSTAPAGLVSTAPAAWVGSELIAWSGDCGSGPSTTGGRYQPPAPL
jgi:hypothetical protein